MKKYGRWWLLALIGLVAVGIVARDIAERATRKQRDEAVGRLHTVLDEATAPEPTAEDTPAEPTERALPETVVPPREELIARWLEVLPEARDAMRHKHDEENPVAGDIVCRLRDKMKTPTQCSEDELALLTAFLEEHEDLLAEIDSLAEYMDPALPYDVARAFKRERFVTDAGPEWRACVHLLALKSMMLALAGETAASVDTITRTIDFWSETPFVDRYYSYIFVHRVIEGVYFDPLGVLMLAGEHAQTLAAQLEKSADPASSSALLAEFARRDLERMACEPTIGFKGNPWYVAFTWTYSTVGSPVRNNDEKVCAGLMSQLVELAGRPHYEVKSELETIQATFDRKRPGHGVSWRGARRAAVIVLHGEPRTQARLTLARLALVIGVYQQEHSAYPESLEGVPALADAMPLDPFSGEPCRYQLTEEGFLLYSVGPNGVDDKGKPGMRDGDIAWLPREEG